MSRFRPGWASTIEALERITIELTHSDGLAEVHGPATVCATQAAAAFAGGWFHSDDLAVTHPDGYMKVEDRAQQDSEARFRAGKRDRRKRSPDAEKEADDAARRARVLGSYVARGCVQR